jgi:uncharacterized protein GlcG (DUF336 family)
MNKTKLAVAALFAGSVMASTSAMADCKTLTTALKASTSALPSATAFSILSAAAKTAANTDTGGYGLPMWVTIVDETGTVCAVTTTPSEKTGGAGSTAWGLSTTDTGGANPWGGAFTGTAKVPGTGGATVANSNASANGASNVQWLGSRVISAQKANTANAFSVDKYTISTANLYTPVQGGNSLFGLQESNPVNASIAYLGTGKAFGTKTDGLTNKRPGGVNVFGGGLALYVAGKKIGAVGVSGDTSCRDHAFAWTVRAGLSAAPNPSVTFGITTFNTDAAGTGTTVTPAAIGTKGDEMIFTSTSSSYWNAWSHPQCPNTQTGAWSVNAP